MLGFMKRFVKIAFFGLLTSILSLPSMAESALADTVNKGTHVTAKLDFSIVVLPSLLLRVRTATQPDTIDTAATVRVEANGGSVSFHSTSAGPGGIENQVMTLAANRKLVHAENPRSQGVRNGNLKSAVNDTTRIQRQHQITYTVAQL